MYAVDGPLHRYLGSLMIRENVEQLGFLDWEKCRTLLEDGFVNKNAVQMRKLFMVTQLVEMSKRFGVKRAAPEYALEEKQVIFEEPLVETQSRL